MNRKVCVRLSLTLGFVAAIFAAPLAPEVQAQRLPGAGALDLTREHVPGSLIVKFRDGASAAERTDAHRRAAAIRLRAFRLAPIDVVQVSGGADLETVAARYRALRQVEYVEPNYLYRATVEPNDPNFSRQWGFESARLNRDIDATSAWDNQTGSYDVIVGVIDTGIDYNHPDLQANVWVNETEANGVPGVDDDGNGIIDDIHGARWTNGFGQPTSGDPLDGNSHGTHVSGTIGAVGNNAFGVAGVNWNVRIMGLKFLNDFGNGATADAISAIEYAVDMGAHLTNNSWGGGAFSQALLDAIDAAYQAGQLFVAAAGNSSADMDISPEFPAGYDHDGILSVGSHTPFTTASYFSNFGATRVDLFAPGSFIISTVPGGGVGYKSGTSMASPHAAGVAALLLAENPALTPDQLKTILMDTAIPAVPLAGLCVTGGRLNADAALDSILP